jgi:glycerol kinase
MVSETTALGAAYVAGLAAGVWDSFEGLRHQWKVDRMFEPEWSAQRRDAGYAGWKRAVARSRGWMTQDPGSPAPRVSEGGKE